MILPRMAIPACPSSSASSYMALSLSRLWMNTLVPQWSRNPHVGVDRGAEAVRQGHARVRDHGTLRSGAPRAAAQQPVLGLDQRGRLGREVHDILPLELALNPSSSPIRYSTHSFSRTCSGMKAE